MAPNPKHPGWGGRRPGAGGKPGRRKLPMPEMPGVRLFDPRPIALRARDYTHLALAGLVRTLCDPEAPHAAVVNAAREMLDRGYGRAVEMKRTLNMGAFDGYTDADLDELIARLQSLENPAPVIDATASQPPSAPMELMGLKPAAHHRLLKALQEMAEGKIDRFAARLSQSNLHLDIVLAVVSGARPRQPPRAYA